MAYSVQEREAIAQLECFLLFFVELSGLNISISYPINMSIRSLTIAKLFEYRRAELLLPRFSPDFYFSARCLSFRIRIHIRLITTIDRWTLRSTSTPSSIRFLLHLYQSSDQFDHKTIEVHRRVF